MWMKKEDGGKVWFEFVVDGRKIGIQGTRTFNPLEDSKMDKVCGLKQIHSSIIRYEGDGCGFIGDGIWTDRKKVMIYIKTADCLPILFYHKEREIVALLHVGWKGTVLKLPQKFLLKMQKDKGIDPSEWVVGFGPSIECKHYQVGTEVKKIFDSEGLNGINMRDGRFHLDLVQANLEELEKFGITEFHLFPEGTYESENFYSYRRGDKGKQITGAFLL